MDEMQKAMDEIQAQVDEAMKAATKVVENFSPKVGYLAANILLLDFSPSTFPAAKAAMEAAASEISAKINYYEKTNRIALIF